MSRKKTLDRIFDLMVAEMNKMLAEGKTVVDKETGEAVKISTDAATLNVIRQFLKDNNISAIEDNPDLHRLNEKLPFPHAGDEAGTSGLN